MKQGMIPKVFATIVILAVFSTLPAFAEFKGEKSLTLTLGGFELNEDAGTIGRWNEYRDISRRGAALELNALNTGGNWLNWWASLENPGYQDAFGSLYMQGGDYLAFDAIYNKTPHYTSLTENQIRENMSTRLSLAPLGNFGATLTYINEEKKDADGGTIQSQDWDAATLAVFGKLKWIDANLEIYDSKLSHPFVQYNADGFTVQAAGAKGRLLGVSAYLTQRDYDAGIPSLLPNTVETKQSGLEGRLRITDAWFLNSSYNKSETNNQNTNGRSYDTDRYKIETYYKFPEVKVGFKYNKSKTDKTNVDITRNESDSLEYFADGRLLKKIRFRASLKHTTRDAEGIRSLDLRSANNLPARIKNAHLDLAGNMSPSLRLSGSLTIQGERYEPVSTISITDRRIETRSQSAVWQATERMVIFQDILYQELVYNNSGILTLGEKASINQTYDRYSLGLAYQFHNNATGGLSYDQARARVGGFTETNEITERNVGIWYEREIRKNLDLHASVTHNTYSDPQDAMLSGTSDLWEISIKKTLNF